MKKLYILAAILLVVSCSNSGHVKRNADNAGADTSAVADTDSLAARDASGETTEKAVTAAVNDIYAEVFFWYKKAEKDVSLLDKAPDFEARYMSAAYNVLYAKVKKADAAAAAKGMVGFFDSSHWVCGQDWGDLRAEVKSVSASNGVASVKVTVWNLGNENNVLLKLVNENGAWKIDDMSIGGTSEREAMQRYVGSK